MSTQPPIRDLSGATAPDVLELAAAHGVRFLRLQFTDILGVNKNVEVPASQMAKALRGDLMFDGSSIEGFVRIEESDMLLAPDLATFRVFPWGEPGAKIARVLCDITRPDGTPFEGDPRGVLKRQVARAARFGFTMMAGLEAEFFLFQRGTDGEPTLRTNDVGSYFDLAPVDRGEDARRAIVAALEEMGFDVEAAHHEVAPGQHEIDFRYADALTTADALATFRFVVRHVAQQFGLHASFMPKPIWGQNGSGMHTHQSLFKDGRNAFWDEKATWELSPVAHWYIGGLLAHARGMCAITNPLVNSYKRLVPGFEAPVKLAYSARNRSASIRIPYVSNPKGRRIEVRFPDPTANPYMAFAAMMMAGLDGVQNKIHPGEAADKNLYDLPPEEDAKIPTVCSSLDMALDYLDRDREFLTRGGVFSNDLIDAYIALKMDEVTRFRMTTHPIEFDMYYGL